jgi:hypothetical protein
MPDDLSLRWLTLPSLFLRSQCMQEIDAFREQEAHEQDSKTDVSVIPHFRIIVDAKY